MTHACRFGAGDHNRSGGRASLRLDREDITFSNLSSREVQIKVRVTNDGDARSARTTARVSAAVLGAFLPWRPLTTLIVPALEPGETSVISAVVPTPAVALLGPPDRVRPQQLLTALGLPDDRGNPTPAQTLPADPMKLLGLGSHHWAGNLNIFLGGRPVERHVAQALRVYPGRTNLAAFFVGTGQDSYLFDLKGTAVDWDATLHDLSRAQSLHSTHAEVPLNTWLPGTTTRILMLSLKPPARCGAGTVEVHVTQLSTSQTAMVEFSLDPSAAGPGCYTV